VDFMAIASSLAPCEQNDPLAARRKASRKLDIRSRKLGFRRP
jgi:hypothetical protein